MATAEAVGVKPDLAREPESSLLFVDYKIYTPSRKKNFKGVF